MNIFIGGSAREEIPQKYKKEAAKLGEKLCASEHSIYCCASNVGVIGEVYLPFIGKYPERIKSAVPKAHLCYKDENQKIDVITNTINERTDYVLQNCDMCIFLPGGIGTIYEIMSAIETKRAHEHNSELIIVNIEGYFDEFLKMLEKVFNENFSSRQDAKVYRVVNNIDEINLL